MKFDKKAFTLIEIMIVVALIAILSSIAIPSLLRARITSNEAVAQATLKSISNALEMYYNTYNQYPLQTSLLLDNIPPYLNEDYFVVYIGHDSSWLSISYQYEIN